MSKNIILFQAHELSEETVKAFQSLKNAVSAKHEVVLLLDTKNITIVPDELKNEIFSFSSLDFKNWGLLTWGKSMLPGHCHFPILRYHMFNQNYDYLWLIEYDVRFTGDWNLFLDSYENDNADLLCCHLKLRSEEPNWYWWKSFDYRSNSSLMDGCTELPIEAASNQGIKHLRCFLVVSRFSKAAISDLIKTHSGKWLAHQEFIVPTSLFFNGFKVRDFNGRSFNCEPITRKRKFYSSSSDLEGSMVYWGSVRFRPSFKTSGYKKNFLYHPVKPIYKPSSNYFMNEIYMYIRSYLSLLKARFVRAFPR